MHSRVSRGTQCPTHAAPCPNQAAALRTSLTALRVPLLLLLAALGASGSAATWDAVPSSAYFVSKTEAIELREQVRGMFRHGYRGYMENAFPKDELKPNSCRGHDTLGGYSLTLIDALDTLALFGYHSEFARQVMWLGEHLGFDKNKTVSLFETNIRVLGGLLSAHLLASDHATGVVVPGYSGELLVLAEDLGRRLLPAFETPTGIPYGSVNLKYGVSADESEVSSTAGGGTLILEFGVLSRLTGDPVFEDVARTALQSLWERRSALGLVGAHINIITGEWTHKDAGIGTSIDSFYEYLFKGHVLLGDEEYLDWFREAYGSAIKHLFHDPWYVEVNMDVGVMVWPLFNSLQAFWPGLQVQAGDVELAVRTHRAFFSVWRRFGFTPEGFNLQHSMVHPGQASYPLRPELAESTYWLYKATRDPWYLEVGRDILTSIELTKCACGYCHVSNVESHALTDHMESFFLAETVKYLFLLFDLAASNGDNLVDNGPYQYILTTEGHMLPMTAEISLASSTSHCSYLGSFCGAPKSSSCRLSTDRDRSLSVGESGIAGEASDYAASSQGYDTQSEAFSGEVHSPGVSGESEEKSKESKEEAQRENLLGKAGTEDGTPTSEQADADEDDPVLPGPQILLQQKRCQSPSFWRSLGLDLQNYPDT